MRRRLGMVTSLIAVALLAVAPAVHAQATTGRISGIVRDSSGGVLPGVSVTVTETKTGFTRTEGTDAQGAFIFVSLPLGNYTVGAELQGFKKASKSGFVLSADGRLTADFNLEVGQFSETVQVTVGAETVNTVSGEVARNVDRAQVQDLALNGRNYLQLASLIPGAPVMQGNMNALDIMTGLGINMSINGSRGNANSLTVDGGFNMDSGSNNSQISNVGVDFIEEVSIKTASFSAEYGRNSGAAINVVTRSGSNTFKGSVYEYLRRDKFDANDWFANLKHVAKPSLKYDNYGFSLGGPVFKDKLFFFGGVEWKKIDRFTAPTFRTIPNSAMRNGDFSSLATSLKDPSTGLAFQGNIIPPNMITADGKAIASVYAAMALKASSYTDTPTTNNALFMDPNPFRFRQEMARLDFQPSGSHRLTGRLVLDHYDLIDPGGTFITSQLPTVPTERMRPGRNVQVNHYWTIGGNLVNEAKFNYSANGQIIPPVGDTWKRDTYGFQFAQVYTGGGRYENSIPDVNVTNFASFRGAAQSLISPTWDYSFSDKLTWIKGAHTVQGGVMVVRNGKDQNGRSGYAGVLTFQTNSNTITSGNAFADVLLGNFYNYNEAQLDPMGYFRFWQREAFVSDAWRVNKQLSVEFGVRYAWQMPTSTLGNNTTSFDPALYSAAQAVTMNTNGTIVAGTGNRYNGLTRPGAVPSDQVANVPNANSPAVATVPNAKYPGYYNTQNLFAPRFSFAYTPFGDKRTVVRGGAGLFYDRPEGNLYFALVNNPPFSLSSSYLMGNLSNIQAGTVPPITPWASMNALDPNMKIPRVWNYNIGVQRDLGLWGLFAEVTYVGAKGQQQIRQPDINYPTFTDIAANAVGAKYSIDYLRPYKGYTSILMRLSDASSTYNSLQVFLSKRRGDLNFSLNYTLSKAMDNGSGNGDNPDSGVAPLAYNYGPSDNDRRHVFVGTWTYRVPFFRNERNLLGYTLGGWEISGIARYQSGGPITITGTQVIGRRADYLGTDPYLAGAPVISAAGVVSYIDPVAFAVAPADRLGNSARGQVRGPSYYNWDISLRKQIPLKGTVKAQFQADFFNAFNMVQFQNPATNLSGSGFGLITAVQPPRNIQLGFRVTF
ncbi:MAG: carboxypeptidase regulatory-like domain-containing protein [Acidobacteria bacterium]|nr:carboxypeptidase regulatory-like domain-containing protein [Acidobacteriota bacterium]